jgi:AmiR/NasT family two-component response regulator
MEDVDLLCSQHAGKIARSLSMTDKQFEEMQALERDVRALLKSRLVKQKEVVAKHRKPRR